MSNERRRGNVAPRPLRGDKGKRDALTGNDGYRAILSAKDQPKVVPFAR